MRKIQRITVLGAAVAAALALAACADASPAPAPAPTPAAPATTAPPAATGETTTAQVFGPACGLLPQGEAPGSLTAMAERPVATAAADNPQLSALTTVVRATGLGSALDQQKAVTVFAPADTAFVALRAELGEAEYAELLADTDALSALLTLHVVGTRYDASGLVAEQTVMSMGGAELTVGGTAQAPTITGPAGTAAAVLCGNIPTANATVFVIDKVLLPKE